MKSVFKYNSERKIAKKFDLRVPKVLPYVARRRIEKEVVKKFASHCRRVG